MNQDKAGQINVRAEINLSGKQLHQTKTVQVRPGAWSSISFDFDDPETTLTVNVPEDAIVHLLGRETRATGAVRTFRTTRLAAGQEWPEYGVRVSLQRNGQLLSKEQTISLKSGDSRHLTFDFEETAVAAAE